MTRIFLRHFVFYLEVYNINYTESREVQAAVIERSQSLKEYSQFIHQVQRRKESGIAAEEALKDAIEYCVQHGILCEFLEKHGSEVRNMLYTEWNLEDACEIIREESLARGRQEGIEKAVRVLKGVLPPEVIAERFELPLEDVLRILAV